ncbi:hypothetical protein CEB3_c13350 [Peptococcaceae bacterium CEB3]|nr:hypothetical protein CEB3_c13350 [Peptococcaceae bacterium CEB3]
MRKIIYGIVYDTEISHSVGTWNNGRPINDACFYEERVYRNPDGEYFLFGQGGVLSCHGSYWHNMPNGGRGITPMTTDEAKTWAKERLDTSGYESEFGPQEKPRVHGDLRGELEPVPFLDMSSKQIRVSMAERGWMSEDQLTSIGWEDKIGYTIWFSRWDWHGVKLRNKVSIHGHSTELDHIRDLVAETAQRALKAWEAYPDEVPVQTFGNKVVPEEDFLQPPEFRKDAKDKTQSGSRARSLNE